MSDVTHRHQAEEARQEIQEAARALANLLAEGVVITSDATVVYANAAGLRMLGAVSPEDIIGKPLEPFLPRDAFGLLHQQGLHQLLQPIACTNGQLLRVDGNPIDVRLATFSIPWHGKAASMTVFSGLRAQSKWHHVKDGERLAEIQKRIDLVVHAGRVGTFEYAYHTDILTWSPVLREICGISTEESPSLQRYFTLIPADEREGIVSQFLKAQEPTGEGTLLVEHRIVKDKADIRHVRVQAFTVFTGEGAARRAVRTYGTLVEILNQTRRDISQRDLSKIEVIGTLAGGIAHEFNNSLTAVLGFSELALSLIPTDSKAHRHIQQVLLAGRRSRDLVHQLLSFSQRGDSSRGTLSLQCLVKESLKLLRPRIPSSIELRERIVATARPISADAAQMHFMTVHLIEHALYAMRKTGGILEVELHDKILPAELPLPDGRLGAGYTCLTVKDTGEGLEPQMASRIFDPSFTASSPTDGRALGLSMVHDIVTEHGGTLLIDSGPELGTTVSVHLPAVPPPLSASLSLDGPLPRGQECILFVDDEESLARFGGEMLESLGYYPVVRVSAADAWEAFQTAPQRFQLLITDQAMPGMTGTVLARKCQRLRPDIPVILCSGSTPLAAEEGFDGAEYMLKPLVLQDLAHTIRRMLDACEMTSNPVAMPSPTSRSLIEEKDAFSTRR